MNDKGKITLFRWAQFSIGVLLVIGMWLIYAFVKEFNIILFALPAALLGLDPTKFFPRK